MRNVPTTPTLPPIDPAPPLRPMGWHGERWIAPLSPQGHPDGKRERTGAQQGMLQLYQCLADFDKAVACIADAGKYPPIPVPSWIHGLELLNGSVLPTRPHAGHHQPVPGVGNPRQASTDLMWHTLTHIPTALRPKGGIQPLVVWWGHGSPFPLTAGIGTASGLADDVSFWNPVHEAPDPRSWTGGQQNMPDLHRNLADVSWPCSCSCAGCRPCSLLSSFWRASE